jgi:2,4-dienoyl-CoA reductase (NADPH2)
MFRVNELGINLLENVDVKRINDEGVLYEKDGKEMTVPADTVINARGAVSNTDLAKALEGKVPILHKIGDCVKPRTALDATREGFGIGLKI